MPTYDLKRFNTRVFETSKAHVPPGGLGCFFARYTPTNQELKVTVNICARFVDPQGQPVPLGVQKSFTDAFEQRVPEYWNNRFRFICTKKGFEGVVAKPAFEVVQTSIANAHYDLKIVNAERGNICVRTGEDPALAVQKDAKYDPYRGKLSAQFQMQAIQANQLTQATNMLTALEKPVQVAIGTTPGQGTFSIAAMERLRTHARDVNYVFEGLERPSMVVRGPGADGKEKAQDTGAVLTRFGYSGELKYEKNGPPGFVSLTLDAKQLARVKSRILGQVQGFPHFAQYAVVHEFGHMLGLPDEYMCCGAQTVGIMAQLGLGSNSPDEQTALTGNTTTKQQDFTAGIAQTQEEFVKLCSQASVPPPPFGRSNPSLMSSGHTFMHCHAVTVLHALWRMTSNYFEMKDWRIDLLR